MTNLKGPDKNENVKTILKKRGITMECESPLEIRDDNTGDRASGYFVKLNVDEIIRETVVAWITFRTEEWHDGRVECAQLSECLGMTEHQYRAWVRCSKRVPLDSLIPRVAETTDTSFWSDVDHYL